MKNIFRFLTAILTMIFLFSCNGKKDDTIVNNYYFYNPEDSLWREIKVPSAARFHDIGINEYDGIYLAGWTGSYMSTDYGNNWRELTKGINRRIVITRIYLKNELITWVDDKDGFNVFKSIDKGHSWTMIYDTIPGMYDGELHFCDSDSKGNIYAAGTIHSPNHKASVFVSTDNAKTWKCIKDSISDFNMFILGIDDILYYKYYGGASDPNTYITFSSDCGLSWHEAFRFNGNVKGNLSQDSRGNLYIINYDNSVRYKSGDHGKTWKALGFNGLHNEYVSGIAESKKGRFYMLTDHGIFASSDDGQNWKQIIQCPYILKACLDSKGYLYALMWNSAVNRTNKPVE